jgi:hypothetical protein
MTRSKRKGEKVASVVTLAVVLGILPGNAYAQGSPGARTSALPPTIRQSVAALDFSALATAAETPTKIEGNDCRCNDPGLRGAMIGAPIGMVAGGILGAFYF